MRERKIKLTCDCCGKVTLISTEEGELLRFGEAGGKIMMKLTPTTFEHDICDDCSRKVIDFIASLGTQARNK